MADDTFPRLLSDAKVRSAKPQASAYKLTDGGGMFLLVQPNGSKLWRYKFRLNSVEGVDSFGAWPEVTLAEAREAHRSSRDLVAKGTHPVKHRQAERERAERERRLAEAGEFQAAFEAWLDSIQHDVTAGTAAQRRREITAYLLPVFKGRLLPTIKRAEISAVLKTAAEKKAHKGRGGSGFRGGPEVARNLRTYLWLIYEWAGDAGLVDSNPVPPPRVVAKPDAENHKAMPVDRLGEFLAALHDSPRVQPETRAAMMLTIYGVTRKVECISARPENFNLEDATSLDDTDRASWELPKEVMKGKKKARRDHWVPLPRQALAMLRELREWDTGAPFLFPNRRDPERHMAKGTLNAALRRLGYDGDATIHGFRAVFSTRYNAKAARKECSEDAVERCLAHKPKDKTRAAYNRFDYAEQRRGMLQDWADWLDGLMAAARAKMEPERLVA